jgi:hypothetical protein
VLYPHVTVRFLFFLCPCSLLNPFCHCLSPLFETAFSFAVKHLTLFLTGYSRSQLLLSVLLLNFFLLQANSFPFFVGTRLRNGPIVDYGPRHPFRFSLLFLWLNSFHRRISAFHTTAFSFAMEQLTSAQFFRDRTQRIAVADASGAV